MRISLPRVWLEFQRCRCGVVWGHVLVCCFYRLYIYVSISRLIVWKVFFYSDWVIWPLLAKFLGFLNTEGWSWATAGQWFSEEGLLSLRSQILWVAWSSSREYLCFPGALLTLRPQAPLDPHLDGQVSVIWRSPPLGPSFTPRAAQCFWW